jgi:hypothetical protein
MTAPYAKDFAGHPSTRLELDTDKITATAAAAIAAQQAGNRREYAAHTSRIAKRYPA